MLKLHEGIFLVYLLIILCDLYHGYSKSYDKMKILDIFVMYCPPSVGDPPVV